MEGEIVAEGKRLVLFDYVKSHCWRCLIYIERYHAVYATFPAFWHCLSYSTVVENCQICLLLAWPFLDYCIPALSEMHLRTQQ